VIAYPSSDLRHSRTFLQAGRTLAPNSSVNKACAEQYTLLRNNKHSSDASCGSYPLCVLPMTQQYAAGRTCRRSSTRALHLCGLAFGLSGGPCDSLDIKNISKQHEHTKQTTPSALSRFVNKPSIKSMSNLTLRLRNHLPTKTQSLDCILHRAVSVLPSSSW